jgi:hypothetical protein
MEASVPVMWAVCGALVFTAFNRVEERSGKDEVETVCSEPEKHFASLADTAQLLIV